MKGKDELYAGAHEAIIDRTTWDSVQSKLKANAIRASSRSPKRHPLAGKLYADGERLTPTHTTKRGKRYRYYITKLTEASQDASSTRWRVPADALESAIVDLIDQWVISSGAPLEITRECASAEARHVLQRQLNLLVEEEAELSRQERLLLWAPRIARIDLDQEGASVKIMPTSLFDNPSDLSLIDSFVLRKTIGIGPRGQGLRLIFGETTEMKEATDAMRALLGRSFEWRRRWFESEPEKTLNELISDNTSRKAEISRELRLAFLAPDLVESLLNGEVGITASQLQRLKGLPPSWREQRRLLGR